jgi:GNAT superfamily N-acetyltransferase
MAPEDGAAAGDSTSGGTAPGGSSAGDPAADGSSAAAAFPHLRVWLEPGYERSRVGGWVLDAPGVFGSGPTSGAALTAALTAAARVREWLEVRGDAFELPPMGRQDVIAEVPARHEPDGYEVNATFEPDHRPVAAADLERALRRMAWAREDLLASAARIVAHEADHGPLPRDETVGERDANAVLRHLAGAEVWLVGRLDASARYGGPLRDAPVAEALEATRAWTVDRLRAGQAVDQGAEVADRHGETWTLAKVVRRLLYHGFDHLWELDRRLVRADGTAERVDVVLDRRPSGEQQAVLLKTVGWDVRASDPDALDIAVRTSSEMATAWDGDRLVGTARSLSDGSLNAYIVMVIVHPAWQGLGIGERLMHALMEGRDRTRFSLAAAPGMDDWYRRLGFEPDPRAMVRPRRRHRT